MINYLSKVLNQNIIQGWKLISFQAIRLTFYYLIRDTRMEAYKPRKDCTYKELICFYQVLFHSCNDHHTSWQKKQMVTRWGDLRHDVRRQLECEGTEQKYPGCKYGMNCIFLFRGVCMHTHSDFDRDLALRIRERLLETKCPRGETCKNNLCFYFHKTKVNVVIKYKERLANVLRPIRQNPEQKQQKDM